jgi:hypothetical protein
MQSLRLAAILCLAIVPSGVGCGEDTESTRPFGKASDFADFISEKTHHNNGWVSETDGPRDASSVVSPHGPVRVFFNDTLVASQKSGNGELNGTPHDEGSMTLKEFYEGDTVVGHAIYYKAAAGSTPESFVYYCEGPQGRCLQGEPEATRDSPIYGAGHDVHCHACHGGMVFTTAA